MIAFCGYKIWGELQFIQEAKGAEKELAPYEPQTDAFNVPDTTDARNKLAALMAINPDVCGWIMLEGTNISYPLVLGKDNSFYLNHTPKKEYLRTGSIFIDAGCARDFSVFNTVIYGHNVRSSKNMFTQVTKYKEKAFFDTHDTGWIITPEATYRIQLYAYFDARAGDDIYRSWFPEVGDRQAHLEMITKTARHLRNLDVTAEDHIVSLSTCTFDTNNSRSVLVGKLVPAP